MTEEAKQVREFMVAAKQELPDKPTIPSLEVRILRAKLMLEECIETITDGLGVDLRIGDQEVSYIDLREIKAVYGSWFEIHPGNLELIADGCADTKVVTIGTELACGIDGDQIFREVHRSNMSKFIDGSFRADGKYIKGPSYSPASIAEILEDQSK